MILRPEQCPAQLQSGCVILGKSIHFSGVSREEYRTTVLPNTSARALLSPCSGLCAQSHRLSANTFISTTPAWLHLSWHQCLVAQLRLCNPMDCSPPASFIHGILQARILAWIVIPFSKGSSQPKDQAQVSHIAGRFFTSEPNPDTLLHAYLFMFCLMWSSSPMAGFYCVFTSI